MTVCMARSRITSHCGASQCVSSDGELVLNFEGHSRKLPRLDLGFWPRLSTPSIQFPNLLLHPTSANISRGRSIHSFSDLKYLTNRPTSSLSRTGNVKITIRSADRDKLGLRKSTWHHWIMRLSRSNGATSKSAMASASAGMSFPAPEW